MARVIGYATGGTAPELLFYAPVVAVTKLLNKLGMKIGDFDLIEANEAFSAQALADGKELGWDPARVNVNGGAVALGHPIGASGARVLVTLLHAMKARGARYGIGHPMPRRRECRGPGGGTSLGKLTRRSGRES